MYSITRTIIRTENQKTWQTDKKKATVIVSAVNWWQTSAQPVQITFRHEITSTFCTSQVQSSPVRVKQVV